MVGGRGRIQFKIWKKTKQKQNSKHIQKHSFFVGFFWVFFGDVVENPHWGISYISRPERSKQAVMWQWKKKIRPRATVVSDPTGASRRRRGKDLWETIRQPVSRRGGVNLRPHADCFTALLEAGVARCYDNYRIWTIFCR